MKYKRLPFEQYFIDTSDDYNNTGKATFKIEYKKEIFKHWLHKHETNWLVRFDEKREVIQIFFEETSGFTDWLSNLNFPAKMYKKFKYKGKSITLKAPSGWKRQWFKMKHSVRKDFEEIYKKHTECEVEIIGWSQGSAYAQYCAQDLFYNYSIKSHLFTFGSVKAFRKIFFQKRIKNYLKDCCKEVYNFKMNNDIVTYMPPFIGYFMINPIKVKQDRFCLFRLFKARKYHTSYDLEKIYK